MSSCDQYCLLAGINVFGPVISNSGLFNLVFEAIQYHKGFLSKKHKPHNSDQCDFRKKLFSLTSACWSENTEKMANLV